MGTEELAEVSSGEYGPWTEHEVDTKLTAEQIAAAKLLEKAAVLHWYDVFEHLMPYSDLLLVLGGLLIIEGVMFWSVPAALVVAGFELIALWYQLGRAV